MACCMFGESYAGEECSDEESDRVFGGSGVDYLFESCCDS